MRQLMIALALLLAPQAQAICVLCSCTVVPDPMVFGTFPALDNVGLNGAANIKVTCTGVAALGSLTLKLDGGVNGNVAQRRMAAGGNFLDYNLYRDSARTQIWGTGAGGYSAVVVPNTLGLLSWTSNTSVWGRVSPAPATPPGAYADVVIVTVEW